MTKLDNGDRIDFIKYKNDAWVNLPQLLHLMKHCDDADYSIKEFELLVLRLYADAPVTS